MKLVFDEWYGTLSYAQRAAYKKYNVSPADHDMLMVEFGNEDDVHTRITAAVKDRSRSGQYQANFGW